MKLKSNDPLQQLLREALHQQSRKVTVTPTPAPILRQCERKEAWTTTHMVALIHRGTDCKETYLGPYDVQVSSLFKARRLVPSHAAAHGKLPREVVTGDYWLHPQVPLPSEDTVREVKAIEARFRELMDLYRDVV